MKRLILAVSALVALTASSPVMAFQLKPGTYRCWVTDAAVAAHTAPKQHSPTYGTIPVGSTVCGTVYGHRWVAVTEYGWVLLKELPA